jgi:1-deoxy-D-xylulose-5-phosphate synthase
VSAKIFPDFPKIKPKQAEKTDEKIGKPLLSWVKEPEDVRKLQTEELSWLADEVREKILETVSLTGGHLGAGLGVVELTIALHYVFNTPNDKLIWDVGHQCYPHKMLTKRADKLHTLRTKDGLSGFTNRSESEFDPFGAGHSSTSISAGLGMAVARDLDKKDNNVVCVIGDGSMSAGMAFEAMNNAGTQGSKLIVILNDNEMSISTPVGSLSAYLSELISSKPYLTLRQMAMDLTKKFPRVKKAEEFARGLVTGGTLFEELGFYYVGPIDGHNFEHLVPILKNIRDAEDTGPVLIHVVTKKGHGYGPAERAPSKYHGVTKFDVKTGEFNKPESDIPTYTQAFSKAICDEAKKDDKILAITAAMPAGTGLDKFKEDFPERFFDVGIAEQHAVTFAAGLACEGFKPYVAIYSSFMQRAYDQLVHDVALQNLPVRFMLDRAGFVGADGATHHGTFDLAFSCNLPNVVVMAPSSQQELINMVALSTNINDKPCIIRYPRGAGHDLELCKANETLQIGKGKIVKTGKKAAILSVGTRLDEALKAAEMLEEEGISVSVADARFAKPFDKEMVEKLAKEHDILLSVEEGSSGGFGSHIMQFLSDKGLLDGELKFRQMCINDEFVSHASVKQQYDEVGLQAEHMKEKIKSLI